MSKLKSKLPSGFKTISGFGDSWKPVKIGESIQGKMVRARVVKVERKKGKKIVKEKSTIYTLATSHGEVDVWESAGLRVLSRVKKGQEVFIQFTGKRVITKGQNPMRVFDVAVK